MLKRRAESRKGGLAPNSMVVQDDRRELEMCALIGLTPGSGRSGVDAAFEFLEQGHRHAVPVELKSTTRRSVSTGRDIGPAHLKKWRLKARVFGFYDSAGATLESLLVLGPSDMEPWIGRIERYIAPDFMIGERLFRKGFSPISGIGRCVWAAIHLLSDLRFRPPSDP